MKTLYYNKEIKKWESERETPYLKPSIKAKNSP